MREDTAKMMCVIVNFLKKLKKCLTNGNEMIYNNAYLAISERAERAQRSQINVENHRTEVCKHYAQNISA